MTSIEPAKRSYKDMLETLIEPVKPAVYEEKQVTYEEWCKIYEDSRIVRKELTKEDIAKQNLIDDTLEYFIDIAETLKDEYNFNGFLNKLNYTELMNVCIKNMKVSEIDESESEDDENNDIIFD